MYDPDSLIMPDIPTDEMKDIPMYGKTLAFGSSPRGDWYDIQQVKALIANWYMPIWPASPSSTNR